MPTTHNEPFAYFKVERPIVSTNHTERFLGKVAYFTANYLGRVTVGSVAETTLDITESSSEIILNQETTYRPTSVPGLEIYSAAAMNAILLQRCVPRSLASRYSFGYSTSLIQGKYRRSLDSISTHFDQDPGRTAILCTDVGVGNTPGLGDELYLVPSSAASFIGNCVLKHQSEEAEQLLGQRRDSRRTLAAMVPDPNSPTPLVPFARLSEHVTFDQRAELISAISSTLPVRLEVGNVWASNS